VAATPGSPDAARVFADFAAGLDFDRIPSEGVACAKKLIIDGRLASGPGACASSRRWQRIRRQPFSGRLTLTRSISGSVYP